MQIIVCMLALTKVNIDKADADVAFLIIVKRGCLH